MDAEARSEPCSQADQSGRSVGQAHQAQRVSLWRGTLGNGRIRVRRPHAGRHASSRRGAGA